MPYFTPPGYLGQSATRSSGRRKEYLPEEEFNDSLSSLMQTGGSAIEFLGKVFDTPGAIARGVLAGDPMSGFSWDTDRRVTGEELLASYGVVDDSTNPYARAAAGFATEIATDPLAWISLPGQALTKAGKVAKNIQGAGASSLLDLAPIAAQRRMGDAAKSTMTGRLADNAFAELADKGIARTDDMYKLRPLVGPRLARATTTLDEVVKASDDPIRAMDDLTKYLNKAGVNYDDIKHEKLGGALGFGFMSPWVTVTPPGSEKVLDALDAAGQAIRWSSPIRYGSSFFDQRVAGQIDTADQMAAMRNFDMRKAAEVEGRRKAVGHALKLSEIPVTPQAAAMLGADTLFSPQGNDFLTRVFENVPTQQDLQIKSLLPGIDDAYKSWDDIRRFNVDEARNLGMRINPYGDQHGVLYSPRRGTEFDFGDFEKGVGRSLFSANSAEGYSRNRSLITPGGTSDLREVSLLPNVRAHAKLGTSSTFTDEQIGQEIAGYLNRKYGYDAITQDQGEAIARTMARINKNLPDDVPVFADHPLNAQSRNIVNQEMARANAKFIYESLADAALNTRANTMVGGRFRRLDTALNDIAAKVGLRTSGDGIAAGSVQKQLLDRVAAKFGTTADRLDLSKVAIPEAVYNRLTKMHDFYSSPKALDEVGNLWNKFTSLTKGSLLAWPSRHVRDAYSNLFSIYLETGSAADTYAGVQMAKKILAGRFDDVAGAIAQMPRYQGIADQKALKAAFMRDVGGEGVLSTLSTSDLLTASRAGDIDQLLPGSTPIRRSDFLKELIPDGSRGPVQMLRDFGTIRNVTDTYQTRNPILNASQRYGDWNDSVGRLGGYLALVRKGVAPSEAARRMREALVDYSSLTPVERHTIRNVFVWWAYSSRIGKWAVTNLLSKPGGRYAQTIRAMNTLQRPSDEHYTPDALRQQFGFRIPDDDEFWGPVRRVLGIPENSQTDTYIKDIDLPGIDVLSLLVPGNLTATAGNIGNIMHPTIRGGVELMTGQDLFSKRPLEESETPLDRIYKWGTGSPVGLPPAVKAVVNQIPGMQRPINLFGGLVDPRIPLEQRLRKQAINAFSGMKLQDVDPQYWISEAQRKNAERLKGWVGRGEFYHMPKDRMEKAPEWVKREYAVQQELQRRRREYNKSLNKSQQ